MKKNKIAFVVFTFVSLLSFSLTAAPVDNIVLPWNKAALAAVQETAMPPPQTARALAIVHTAMYDAWSAYTTHSVSTRRSSTLRRPIKEHIKPNKKEAISFAAYRTLLDLFPSQEASFTKLMSKLGYDPNNQSLDTTTPAGIGNLSAAEILFFRHSDGSNQLGDEINTPVPGTPYADYTGYEPVNTPTYLKNPNRWQPLMVNKKEQVFLTPHWGCVIPFALVAPSKYLPTAPATHPSIAYTKEAKELLQLSAALDCTSKSIAEYWSDGTGTVTPPGHWNVIATFVSHRDKHSIDEDIQMFFILNNAMLDSSVAVWNTKRVYDSVRPISSIRFLFKDVSVRAWAGPGKGTKKIMGQKWEPYLSTPPFAEHVSGHSTFSAAAAEVLRLFTKSDIYDNFVEIPKGSSIIEPGITPKKDVKLVWKTFTEAADQAGISRRYGGIHFLNADMKGRELGKLIGNLVFRTAFTMYITGEHVDEHTQ